MASYFETFRNLEKRSLELKLLFPPELPPSGTPGSPDYFEGIKPEIEFTVKRLNQVQLNNARFAGEALARQRGCHPDDADYGWQKHISIEFKMSEQVVSHITGWRALDDSEAPPFEKNKAKAFVESLDFDGRIFLGRAYFKAEAEDEKKFTAEPTSGTDS